MAKQAKAEENDGWVRPAHSAFEAPTIGEVVPVGTVRKYQDGTTYVITEDGAKRVK